MVENKQPFISFVIPTCNRQELLIRSIQSILVQITDDCEIVVVNDGSTDQTLLKLEELTKTSPFVKYFSQSNKGVNSARNLAVKNAHGKWLFLLDDDDELLPESLNKAINILRQTSEDVSVVFFNTVIKNNHGEEFIGGYQLFPNNENIYIPSYEDFLFKRGLKGDCKPVLRREIFDKQGLFFDETVNGFESYYFSSLIKKSIKFIYRSELSTLIHQEHDFERLSDIAASRKPKDFFELNRRMLNEHYAVYSSKSTILAQKYFNLASLAWRSGLLWQTVKNLFWFFYTKLFSNKKS